MFRTSKAILLAIIISITFILFSGILKEYNKETIPSSPICIQINYDSHKSTKTKIFSTFSKLAHADKYQLTLVRLMNINGKSKKQIYSFNPQKNTIFSLYKNSKKNKIKNIQLEDVRGTYYTNAQGPALIKLQDKIAQLGLSSSISKATLFSLIKESLESSTYILIILSIFSILLILMFIEKISQFKKYAILQLNGLSNIQVLKRDIVSDYPAFLGSILLVLCACCIYSFNTLNNYGLLLAIRYGVVILVLTLLVFVILDFVSYSSLFMINIYSAIQGKSYSKPFVIVGYILKIGLVVIVTMNMFFLNNKVSTFIRDQNTMEMWLNHHSGYTVQFTNISKIGQKEEDRLGRLTRKLIDNNSDVIVSRNSQEFHPDVNNPTPENGNVLLINDNYLKYNKISQPNNRVINRKDITPNDINVLIPTTRQYQKKQFSKDLKAFIDFQRQMPNSDKINKHKKLKINFIKYKGNQRIFNYTIGKDIQDSISNDPIIIIDNNLFSDNFYLAAITQGMIQFSNLRNLRKQINKLTLQNYVTGITDAKTRLSDFNVEQSRQILFSSVIVLISVIQLLLVIAFISTTFLQNNRLKMAVTKIFGQSNWKSIFRFWILNVIGDAIIICSAIILKHESWQNLLYLLPYLIIESIVIWILTCVAQKKLLLTLNRGN